MHAAQTPTERVEKSEKVHANFWANIARHLIDPVFQVEIYADGFEEALYLCVSDSVAMVRQPLRAPLGAGAWQPDGAGMQVVIPGLSAKIFRPLPDVPTASGPADVLLRALSPFVPKSRRDRARFALVLGPDGCHVEQPRDDDMMHVRISLPEWEGPPETVRVVLDGRRLRQLLKISEATMLDLYYTDPATPVRIEGDTLSAVLMPVDLDAPETRHQKSEEKAEQEGAGS